MFFFSDIDSKEVLSKIEKNIKLNQDLIVGCTRVMPLNFSDTKLPFELWKKLGEVNIIIASDGSYNMSIFLS